MKALFAHDHIFYKDKEGNYYSKGSLNSELWSRYLKNFEKLIVVGRTRTIENLGSNLSISNKKGVSFIDAPSISGIKLKIKNSRKVKRILIENINEVDFVISRLPSEIGSEAIKIAIQLGKPYLVEVVGCAWDSMWHYGNIKGILYAPVLYLRTRNIIKKSNYVIYVTKEYLQKRYPSKGRCISCSDVEIKSISKDTLEKRILKIENMNGKKLVLGTAGNIGVLYKGHENVIKAIHELKMIGIEVEYQLIGAGDKLYLENKAREYDVIDNVKFVGVLKHSEVFKWLDNIDIYIQPSLVEGLPRSVIEAMSRGCPTIGTNAGGIPELISSKYIYRKDSVEELVKLIIKIKNDMKDQAFSNYNKSLEFLSVKLDKKRDDYYNNILKKLMEFN